MLRAHATLAAFLVTSFLVAILGFGTGWRLWVLEILLAFASLFILARLFAGLPLTRLDSGDADAEKGYVSPLSPLSNLRGHDMAGIGAKPDELSQAYDDWISAKQGDVLADGSIFEGLANEKERDR